MVAMIIIALIMMGVMGTTTTAVVMDTGVMVVTIIDMEVVVGTGTVAMAMGTDTAVIMAAIIALGKVAVMDNKALADCFLV
jgi:hypothetical protein